MIAHRHISKILVVLVSFSVIICLIAMFFSEQLTEALGGKGIVMDYETKLFDTNEIIDIDILMDDDQWEEMLSNAISEEYYQCDVVINGTTFYSVGIRSKGNTSLSSIVNDPDTDRYSFKLEFDQYVKKQSCWGLDKLVLNNSYADYTYMKEALVYDMYQYLDADASLYNYAKISVNGEYWGAYLALEAVEDSFLMRNYGTNSGKLYKPDSMDIGNMGGGLPDMPNRGESDSNPHEMPERDTNSFSPAGGKGGFQMGSNGANLNYTDDDLDSYSAIWEGEVSKTSDSDHRRVVAALKNISEANDLEACMDVDNLLKYMAVHVFSVNDDSLSGSMAHNYYLYEEKGQLNIIPWDYNLAFGGMNGGSGTDVVNDAIDMPFSATEFFDALLENDEYFVRYHEYLRQLSDEYIGGGIFDEFYSRCCSQIDPLVQTDPTAFCSYEEYLTASDTLYQLVYLRGDSIKGQLEGTIPSTESGQREDSSAMIDASAIDLDSMGTMFGGHGGGGFNMGELGEDFFDKHRDRPSEESGTLPEDSDLDDLAGMLPEGMDLNDLADRLPQGFEMPSFEASGTSSTDKMESLIFYGIYLLLLFAALIFVKLYHKRPYRRSKVKKK